MKLLRWDFELKEPPIGITMSATQGPGTVEVQPRGFYTSDDGPHLYTYLDSFYGQLLAHGVPLQREQIQSAFVSIKDGTKATAVINAPVMMSIVAKADVTQGQPVNYDLIADIDEVRIVNHELPTDGAIAYLFQHGWRRGFYFDFRANDRDAEPDGVKLGNVAVLLGSLHAALALRERVRMDHAVLLKMARAGWFPFTRLSDEHAVGLYRHFEYDWDTKRIIDQIVAELTPRMTSIVESWATKPAFQPHMDVLRTACRLFVAGEHVGAASTVLPKVEGVLRHLYVGTNARPSSRDLRNDLVGRFRASVEGYTALLPESFIQFLETHYYAHFDLASGSVPPSRHSFMHGVGPDDQLKDPTFALRLFLMLDQVFFCVSRIREDSKQ